MLAHLLRHFNGKFHYIIDYDPEKELKVMEKTKVYLDKIIQDAVDENIKKREANKLLRKEEIKLKKLGKNKNVNATDKKSSSWKDKLGSRTS